MTRNHVKKPLTPRRCKVVVQNDEFHAFATRVVRAYARRVADGDVEALPAIVGLADELNVAVHQAVHGLRAFGYSWGEIAARLGITRQGAWQRWNATRPSAAAHEAGGEAP